MMDLVIATKNRGKLKEFKEMLSDIPLNIISLLDFPGIEVEESGSTFEENAVMKAKKVLELTGIASLGDDSGLEVAALGGRPGVHTARFAGPGAGDVDNINKLLNELKGVPWEKRQARFVCCLCFALPDGRVFVEYGYLKGLITFEPRGTMGFGYDPVFFVPELGKTLAEATPEEKNAVSHRARATEKIRKHILQCTRG
ncbi:XTP/dITP diphosphatase [Thermosediminibacter oceani]|uniref:dITP/XTP pyrophosphatase n=1 Tax=Thermosediminibacter oceani (strain ATCC BAA-1034 / DSM 16646 / JW/IW-1228P) TaxID=555079 RepID=D9RYU2_THEOJ|nr:XTP/dITP diphosphatase [Thermosediminibacter oceani]ADL08516.1 non-canonical purine NTP pyrophosphatase, rdgB/HAM1 family [Thermosediminibacter oceani DSM 16646]